MARRIRSPWPWPWRTCTERGSARLHRDGRGLGRAGRGGRRRVGDHLAEQRAVALPAIDDGPCPRAAGLRKVPAHEIEHELLVRSVESSGSSSARTATMSLLQRTAKFSASSSTYATPLDIPAAKFRPTCPRTTTTPAVMYSQQWLPAPSMTAIAPELRTAKRSPTRPAANSAPQVAPYRATLPRITLRCVSAA